MTIAKYLLAVLLLLGAPTATSAVNATSCGDLVVRALLNEGYATNHKNCTDADFVRVLDAVTEAFDAVGSSGDATRARQLTAAGQEERKHRQLVNCADLCEGKTRNTCMTTMGGACYSYGSLSSNCPPPPGLCYRRLVEEPTYIVLDDEWDRPVVVGGDNGGDRKLVDVATTCGISEEDCIHAKAQLYQTILSVLGDLDTTCANLILSPSLLQCMVAVWD
jgi:hypothetical protein